MPKRRFIFSMFFIILLIQLILFFSFSLNLSFDLSLFRDSRFNIPILSSDDDPELMLGNSIFFLETSLPNNSWAPLTPRQACSVESAAKQNPHRRVYLIYSSFKLKNPTNELTRIINKYCNVRIVRIELEEFARGTEVEGFLKMKEWSQSKYPVSHASEILRLLTLFKYGGTYLDLDFVIVKDLVGLSRDWVVKQKDDEVNGAAIDLSQSDVGRNSSKLFLSELVNNYNGGEWAHNGPHLITTVLTKKICQSKDINQFNRTTCRGIEVYGPQVFYPIGWQTWRWLFRPKRVSFVANMHDAYAFHLWNRMSKDEQTSPDIETPYTFLAKKYCPLTYQYSKNFF